MNLFLAFFLPLAWQCHGAHIFWPCPLPLRLWSLGDREERTFYFQICLYWPPSIKALFRGCRTVLLEYSKVCVGFLEALWVGCIVYARLKVKQQLNDNSCYTEDATLYQLLRFLKTFKGSCILGCSDFHFFRFSKTGTLLLIGYIFEACACGARASYFSFSKNHRGLKNKYFFLEIFKNLYLVSKNNCQK